MNDGIRIMCFGDSLTEGYTHFGMEFHPYGVKMKECLQKALPNMRFLTQIEGRSGDRVCPPGNFMSRIEGRFKTGTFDWVVLLGGTNDLGWGVDAPHIFEGLKNVEKVALDGGAKILIMTVPEVANVHKNLDARRNSLNASIKAHCDDSNIFLFDMHEKIPYHSLPPAERERLWDDGVHLTAEGYDLMGEYVAERLTQLISSPKPKEQPASKSEEKNTEYGSCTSC